MSNFFVALYAVLPMFIMLAIGFTVRKMKVIEEAHLPVLNKIVFNVFFPFLMFNNIYAFDLSADFNASLLLYAVVAVAVIYGLSVGFALIFEKSNKSRGALIQAIYRSNFVLMGLPIVGNIFGSGRLGMTSMLVTVIVPMYNILAVITLEVFRGESIKITKILKGIVTNPLIIGSVAGISFAAFGIKLPEIAESVISDMASAATPLALIVLGASFEFASIKRYKKNLIAVIFARLIIVPAISLSVAIMIGFRGIDLVSLIGIFASPCAVSSYTMANLKTSMPKADTLAKIADYLNCSVDYLLGRTDNPEINKINDKKPLIIEEINTPTKKTIILPFYRTPASAGAGSLLSDETPIEYTNVTKTEKTSAADFILEVRGDSMQPKFFDGDCVLVKQTNSIYEEEIGVFILNNESYIKKMGRKELISLNPAYEPIKLSEYDDIRCAGKVIGTVEL